MGPGDFDEDAYLRSVVRPMRGSPKDLPPDLRERYALPTAPPFLDDPARLGARIAAVVGLWQQLRRSDLVSLSRVGSELLDGHERLLTDRSVRLEDAAWWQAYRPPAQEDRAVAEVGNAPGPAVPGSPVAGSPVPEPPVTEPTVPPPAAGGPPLLTWEAGSDGPPDALADLDRPAELQAEHQGRTVRLSWTWPSWAGEAQVSWDGHVRRLWRDQIRSEGWWTSPEVWPVDTDLTFTVQVRGTTPGRTSWSPGVATTIAPPPLEVTYAVRRLRRWGTRAYEVTLTTDRPPLTCEVVVVFARGHLPAKPDDGEELARLYLTWAGTGGVVTVDRSLGPGWLRCFVHSAAQPVVLVDPDIATLQVR